MIFGNLDSKVLLPPVESSKHRPDGLFCAAPAPAGGRRRQEVRGEPGLRVGDAVGGLVLTELMGDALDGRGVSTVNWETKIIC